MGLSDFATASVSHSLTPKIIKSGVPADTASSVALTGLIRVLPCVSFSISRPCSRIAARCAPRATNVTSQPLCARRPPKRPPTPPEPIMSIFILLFKIKYLY